MSPSHEQRSTTIEIVGDVGRRVLGTLRGGLRVGGRALERLRPLVERGLAVAPGSRGDRSSHPSATPDEAPGVPAGSPEDASRSAEVTPADVAARVAPRPGSSTPAQERRTTRSAPGDRLPPRRPGPAPEPVRPADS